MEESALKQQPTSKWSVLAKAVKEGDERVIERSSKIRSANRARSLVAKLTAAVEFGVIDPVKLKAQEEADAEKEDDYESLARNHRAALLSPNEVQDISTILHNIVAAPEQQQNFKDKETNTLYPSCFTRADRIHGRHVTARMDLVDDPEDNALEFIPRKNMVMEILLMLKVESFKCRSSLHSLVNHHHHDPKRNKSQVLENITDDVMKNQTSSQNNYYLCLVRRSNDPLLASENSKKWSDRRRSSMNASTMVLEDSDNEEDEYGRVVDEAAEEFTTPQRRGGGKTIKGQEQDSTLSPYPEVSSPPVLICLSLTDEEKQMLLVPPKDRFKGFEMPFIACMDMHHLQRLESPSDDSPVIHFIFRNGEAVEVHCSAELEHGLLDDDEKDKKRKARGKFARKKERVLWCLTEFHSILCSPDANKYFYTSSPPTELITKNFNRSEVQYLAAVHGFLASHPALFALKERTRNSIWSNQDIQNFSFSSEKEEKEAEEVLNSINWQDNATSSDLVDMLQRRMKDLERETCRRLIAWEDEKSQIRVTEHKETSLSLTVLNDSLDELDFELQKIEAWLQCRVEIIKPLLNECREMEKENEAVMLQWKNIENLEEKLKHVLHGLEVDPELMKILKNPVDLLERNQATGNTSMENEVETMTRAGRALAAALESANVNGGLHISGVEDKVQDLLDTSELFCEGLVQTVTRVMLQLTQNVFSKFTIGNFHHDSHNDISKKIRDAQRRFHASLLMYIPLIEVITLLRPNKIPTIRETYAAIIGKHLLSDDVMTAYFAALPGDASKLGAQILKLSSYPVTRLNETSTFDFADHQNSGGAVRIKLALSEILPVIVREAFFTSAFFRLSTKAMDGRTKRANFEIAKKSVDASSSHFRTRISKACGIGSLEIVGDPMLSFVASFLLNESMEGYFDKQKKGGDHSLSLAYIRSTILELRKQVDKQWGSWIENQIQWVLSSEGVPISGKSAGVFASFQRFPSYLDHLLINCNDMGDIGNLVKVKVVNHYLQKLAASLFESLNKCAVRETTDQMYAANVMRMENSYYFFQSVKERKELQSVFHKQLTTANAICKQAVGSYISWKIKREFKGMYSLFTQISKIRRDFGESDVHIHIPKGTLRNTLAKETGLSNIKSKIKGMYERMEKHLSEESTLLPYAWKALVKDLYNLFVRWEKLSKQCYGISIEPSVVDIVRIAKNTQSLTSNKDGFMVTDH